MQTNAFSRKKSLENKTVFQSPFLAVRRTFLVTLCLLMSIKVKKNQGMKNSCRLSLRNPPMTSETSI